MDTNTLTNARPKPGFAFDLLRTRDWRLERVNAPQHGVKTYRSIWISDLHLGSRLSKAPALLDFLDRVQAENLYLVGDIIDEWKLQRSYYWPAEHEAVLDRFVRMAADGTRVVYLAGNHDDSLRASNGAVVGGIECRDDIIHETADGRRFLVLHGDRFDEFSARSSWLVRVGDIAYSIALSLNAAYNGVGRRLGLRYRSLSMALKQRVKEAVRFISQYEEGLAAVARERKVDGVICGHIHKAEIRDLGGVMYGNDGDWVESCTALVEQRDGRIELVQWRDDEIITLNGGAGYTAPEPTDLGRRAG